MKYYEKIEHNRIYFFRHTKLIDLKSITKSVIGEVRAMQADTCRDLQYFLADGFQEISHQKYIKYVAYWKKTLKLHWQLKYHNTNFSSLYIYARTTQHRNED